MIDSVTENTMSTSETNLSKYKYKLMGDYRESRKPK